MKKQILISLIIAVLIGLIIGAGGFIGTGGASSSSADSAFDIAEIEKGDFIVKTDEEGALPTLSKNQLKKACNCLSGEQKRNALKFIDDVKDTEDKYKVNAVFSLAVFRKENGIATDKSGLLGKDTYNIGSISGRYNNQYVIVTHSDGTTQEFRKYSNYDEAIVDYAEVIANGEIYFKAGKYTIQDIGVTYCNQDWVNVVKEYVIDFYKAAGVSTNTTSGTGEIAKGGKGTIGTYKSTTGKTYSLYLQGGDATWAKSRYGNERPKEMWAAGCGPTAEAIIASAYDGKITPETTRTDIVKYNGDGNHSSSDAIAASLKRLVPNIKAEYGNYDDTKVKNCLKNGGQIWLVVQYCKYTSHSHCIALIDYKENGKVYVAHGTASNRPYGWDDLSYIKQYRKYSSIVYVGGN